MNGGDGPCEVADHGAQDRATEIADRATARNRARAQDLESWLRTARERELTEPERTVAADVAHQLAGSAGTFGFQAATDNARELEHLLVDARSDQDWDRAEECVQAIVDSLDAGPDIRL